MAATASSLDEEAVSRWDGDGGSQAPAPRAAVRPDAHQFLRDVGLDGLAEVEDGEVVFPLGVLWPYTSDLRHVRDEYDTARSSPTVALLTAIATLYERIAFAPGGAGSAVAIVYNDVKDALDARRAPTDATRVCSRCRKEFPVLGDAKAERREGWWLCPPCHHRLIGRGSRAGS